MLWYCVVCLPPLGLVGIMLFWLWSAVVKWDGLLSCSEVNGEEGEVGRWGGTRGGPGESAGLQRLHQRWTSLATSDGVLNHHGASTACLCVQCSRVFYFDGTLQLKQIKLIYASSSVLILSYHPPSVLCNIIDHRKHSESCLKRM